MVDLHGVQNYAVSIVEVDACGIEFLPQYSEVEATDSESCEVALVEVIVQCFGIGDEWPTFGDLFIGYSVKVRGTGRYR